MKRLLLWLGLLAFMLGCGAAEAGEEISVCFNYGCVAEEYAYFSEAQMATLGRMLGAASSPLLERKILADVIGQMYAWAGQQTPVYADRGGNMADDGVRGGMDCIDHSTTTTRFLKALERRHSLKFHRVGDIVRRRHFFIFEHYSAAIEVLPVNWLPSLKISPVLEWLDDDDEPRFFVVDSWFVNNGEAAIVLPLDDWMDGGGPDVDPG